MRPTFVFDYDGEWTALKFDKHRTYPEIFRTRGSMHKVERIIGADFHNPFSINLRQSTLEVDWYARYLPLETNRRCSVIIRM